MLYKTISVSIIILFGLGACGGGSGSSSSPSSSSTSGAITSAMGVVTISEMNLPDGHPNAKEREMTAHYIARTNFRTERENIIVPMRSYSASCKDPVSQTEKMYISMTLQTGATSLDTSAAVIETSYDEVSGSLEPTGNQVILNHCKYGHGIATSTDCSRVAMLCQTDYQASKTRSSELDKDLISGTISNQPDNAGILTSSFTYYANGTYPNIPKELELDESLLDGVVPISAFLDALRSAHPGDSATWDKLDLAYTDLSAAHFDTIVKHQKFLSNLDEVTDNYVASYLRTSDELWLLEWNNESLLDDYDAYLVNNRSPGSAGMAAHNLIYREDDPRGPSYAFAAIQQVLTLKSTHSSSSLNIIDRNTWSIDYLDRGWDHDCLEGHIINSRAFYHEQASKYGAFCSSDFNDLRSVRLSGLSEIGVKYENERSDSTGGIVHYATAHSSWMLDGGAHKAIGLDEDTALAILVGVPFVPYRISTEMMDKYMTNMVRADVTDPSLSDIEACLEYFDERRKIVSVPNCYYAYLTSYRIAGEKSMGWQDDDHYIKPLSFSLNNNNLEPQNKSQIGLARVDANGDLETGTSIKWVANDPDCMLSDPRLVDLENGRYLLGYAKFACYSDNAIETDLDGDGNIEYASPPPVDRIAGDKTLIPKAYYLVEIDAEGNLLTDPIKLTDDIYGDIGWGGIDEMVYLGNGKVSWTYMPNPTYKTISDNGKAQPQSNRWFLMTYQSASYY